MNAVLSSRIGRVKPSPTLVATARAAELRAAGQDIVSLTAGEPDFDTPAHIAEAGIAAIRAGQTRYTDVGGTPALKDAIIAKFEHDNDLRYARNQVLVSSGAKQTIYNLCMAVLDPGDEVVIPAPYWVSYPDMVGLADARPVIVPTGPGLGYRMTPAQLEAAITPRTRLLILCSPSNPTGAAYSRADLAALGAVLRRHPRVLVCTDDMYEKIWWADEPFSTIAQVVPELQARTITVNGCSKAYAMTGWRIGYCGGPQEIIAAMATIQGQSTSNPCSISQQAALAALQGDQSCVAQMCEAYHERHDLVVAGLNALPGIRVQPGAGTFYAFADVTQAMDALGQANDEAFTDFLLTRAGVAVVAGSGFGAPGHVRISFATSRSRLEQALQRMDAALKH
ncbi:MAG: pyridoxal phosphate-dependent aminotransferase [Sinobacteraceae bacterium]|nr:pyridoxal phosphate-dependent aminotransferase [Nevskiaceae bacterium]MCP5359949.1 pyridoxal phosphate-dependent aminotransferase [Nevskiaceae bacterium]MCP5472232.1 pyridoxal phosphate-dependent aminotransferase [Nevskiaceae bacterium]